jgi:hypothetical protein
MVANIVLPNCRSAVRLIGEYNHHTSRHATKRQFLVHIGDDLALYGFSAAVRHIVDLVALKAVDADRV